MRPSTPDMKAGCVPQACLGTLGPQQRLLWLNYVSKEQCGRWAAHTVALWALDPSVMAGGQR